MVIHTLLTTTYILGIIKTVGSGVAGVAMAPPPSAPTFSQILNYEH